MMEWNAKTPFQWDWENLVMFNGKEIDIPKQIQSTEWGINSESLYLSGDVGGSGSDLGNGSSSKSSISASVNSSSNLGTKMSKSNFEAVNGFAKEVSEEKELGRVEDNGTSPRLRASVGCNESLIGLKLGKRTYFEDVCTGSTIKPSSFSVIHTSSISTTKRSRASYQSTESSICQVEGCKLDLTSAKDYHRRHRVCESHSKCPKVIVAGRERRFCQQCSRFHDLVEFDEKKRSCRRRLSDHNARRRKPQPEAVQLNSTRLTSSFYDRRQQMSLVLDRVPLVRTRPTANPTWESTCDFKDAQEKGSSMKPAKAGGIGRQVHFPINDLPNAISMLHHNSNRLFPFKGTTAEVLNQGLEAPLTASNLDATSGLQRALSLLSNSTAWGSGEPDLTSLNQIMHVNHVVHPIEPPVMQMVSQGYPFTLSEYCQAKQQEAESRVHSLTFENNSSNQFQESQLFKAPYDSGFYANQQN